MFQFARSLFAAVIKKVFISGWVECDEAEAMGNSESLIYLKGKDKNPMQCSKLFFILAKAINIEKMSKLII